MITYKLICVCFLYFIKICMLHPFSEESHDNSTIPQHFPNTNSPLFDGEQQLLKFAKPIQQDQKHNIIKTDNMQYKNITKLLHSTNYHTNNVTELHLLSHPDKNYANSTTSVFPDISSLLYDDQAGLLTFTKLIQLNQKDNITALDKVSTTNDTEQHKNIIKKYLVELPRQSNGTSISGIEKSAKQFEYILPAILASEKLIGKPAFPEDVEIIQPVTNKPSFIPGRPIFIPHKPSFIPHKPSYIPIITNPGKYPLKPPISYIPVITNPSKYPSQPPILTFPFQLATNNDDNTNFNNTNPALPASFQLTDQTKQESVNAQREQLLYNIASLLEQSPLEEQFLQYNKLRNLSQKITPEVFAFDNQQVTIIDTGNNESALFIKVKLPEENKLSDLQSAIQNSSISQPSQDILIQSKVIDIEQSNQNYSTMKPMLISETKHFENDTEPNIRINLLTSSSSKSEHPNLTQQVVSQELSQQTVQTKTNDDLSIKKLPSVDKTKIQAKENIDNKNTLLEILRNVDERILNDATEYFSHYSENNVENKILTPVTRMEKSNIDSENNATIGSLKNFQNDDALLKDRAHEEKLNQPAILKTKEEPLKLDISQKDESKIEQSNPSQQNNIYLANKTENVEKDHTETSLNGINPPAIIRTKEDFFKFDNISQKYENMSKQSSSNLQSNYSLDNKTEDVEKNRTETSLSGTSTPTIYQIRDPAKFDNISSEESKVGQPNPSLQNNSSSSNKTEDVGKDQIQTSVSAGTNPPTIYQTIDSSKFDDISQNNESNTEESNCCLQEHIYSKPRGSFRLPENFQNDDASLKDTIHVEKLNQPDITKTKEKPLKFDNIPQKNENMTEQLNHRLQNNCSLASKTKHVEKNTETSSSSWTNPPALFHVKEKSLKVDISQMEESKTEQTNFSLKNNSSLLKKTVDVVKDHNETSLDVTNPPTIIQIIKKPLKFDNIAQKDENTTKQLNTNLQNNSSLSSKTENLEKNLTEITPNWMNPPNLFHSKGKPIKFDNISQKDESRTEHLNPSLQNYSSMANNTEHFEKDQNNLPVIFHVKEDYSSSVNKTEDVKRDYISPPVIIYTKEKPLRVDNISQKNESKIEKSNLSLQNNSFLANKTEDVQKDRTEKSFDRLNLPATLKTNEKFSNFNNKFSIVGKPRDAEEENFQNSQDRNLKEEVIITNDSDKKFSKNKSNCINNDISRCVPSDSDYGIILSLARPRSHDEPENYLDQQKMVQILKTWENLKEKLKQSHRIATFDNSAAS